MPKVVVRRQIPEELSDEGGRLGRHVEHDPRSRDYPVTFSRQIPTRVAVSHRRRFKAFDQGNLGSCTGNAVVGASITDPTYRPGKNWREPMAVKVYRRATEIDGFPGVYPPDDTGSSGLAACKAAVERKLIRSYQHAFSIDQALDALQLRAIITGLVWYEGYDYPDSKGRVKIAGQIRGGHEFEVLGYDPGDGTPAGSWVECCNSWSPVWGLNGRFWMRVSEWADLLADYGDVTVPVK